MDKDCTSPVAESIEPQGRPGEAASSGRPVDFASVWTALTIREEDGLPFDATRRATLPSASRPSGADLPHITLSGLADDPAHERDGRGKADLEIRGLLGEGGMGRVHVAHQRSLDREVAIKTVRPEVRDPAAIATLIAEAVITGSLEHPSIVPVHAMGVDRTGRPLLVMKRVEGFTWADLLHDPAHPGWARLPNLPSERLVAHLEILLHVCNAIELAHSRGIVHRDIKPGNVMVGSFGEVYVVDWGIAARIESLREQGGNRIVGTPAYMAPELVSADLGPVDERTDVYLLGATLHEILTGRPRHEGTNLFQVLSAAFESRPQEYGVDVAPELAAIGRKATQADRELRYPSARDFRQAVSDYLHHRGSIALSDAARRRLEELTASGSRAGEDPEGQHRLMTECRFGFMQALGAWPENEAARRGLDRCLEVMLHQAIAERRPSSARALLAELEKPSPVLAARIDELEVELANERTRKESLERMEKDLDLNVSSRGRVRLTGFLTLALLLASAITIGTPILTGREPGHRELLGIEVGATTVIGVLTYLGRRDLFRNSANRRVLVAVVAGATGIVINRLAGLVTGTAIAATCAADAVLLGGVVSMLAATVMPRLWRAVPLFLATAVVATAWPVAAMSALSVSVCLMFTLVWQQWRHDARRARPD